MEMNVKLFITIAFLLCTLSSWVYALVLLIKYLRGNLNRDNVVKKTFWSTFWGWLSMFIAYLVWGDSWKIDALVFYFFVAVIFSFFGALAFTGSLLFRKRE